MAATVGLAAPFEGAQRELGYEVLAALKIALAEQNAAGGFGGRPVVLAALNDEGAATQAMVAARAFTMDPSVIGVVGHWSRQTTEAALPIYVRAGLPLVVPNIGSYPGLARPAFQLTPTDDQLVQALVAYLQEGGAGRRVMLDVRSSSLASGLADALRAAGFSLATSAGAADVTVLYLDDATAIARYLVNWDGRPLILLDVPSVSLWRELPSSRADALMAWTPVVDAAWFGPFFEAYVAKAGYEPSPQAWLAYLAARRVLGHAVEKPAIAFGTLSALWPRR